MKLQQDANGWDKQHCWVNHSGGAFGACVNARILSALSSSCAHGAGPGAGGPEAALFGQPQRGCFGGLRGCEDPEDTGQQLRPCSWAWGWGGASCWLRAAGGCCQINGTRHPAMLWLSCRVELLAKNEKRFDTRDSVDTHREEAHKATDERVEGAPSEINLHCSRKGLLSHGGSPCLVGEWWYRRVGL